MNRSTHENSVLEQLERVVPLTTRKMFGCIGVYTGEVFFAVVYRQHAYFKVDAQNRSRYEARGMDPLIPFANGKQIRSFYQVPPEVLDEPNDLREWVADALAAAHRKKG